MLYPLYENPVVFIREGEIYLWIRLQTGNEHLMISIIIPLFNERDNIIHYNTDLFPVIEDIAKKYHEEVEFIFVDDGSKDDTIKKIQEIADIRSNIRIAQHGTNKGMGNAIKTGLALCKGETCHNHGCRSHLPAG